MNKFTERYLKLRNKTEQFIESVKNSALLSTKKESALPYAYPCENYIDTILSNKLVRKTLQSFSEKHCEAQIKEIKSSGLPVTQSNYPRLYNVLQSCYRTLNVDNIPNVYITARLKGINALSVGTDNAPIILISRSASICLSEGELKFMIGHELGHILQKNLMCHTIKGLLDNLKNKSEILGSVVSDIIDVPLNEWYRCSEITADRAGYLCCKNMDEIEMLFHKTFEKKSIQGYHKYLELYRHHPLIQSRIEKIKEFEQEINNRINN